MCEPPWMGMEGELDTQVWALFKYWKRYAEQWMDDDEFNDSDKLRAAFYRDVKARLDPFIEAERRGDPKSILPWLPSNER